MTDGREARTGWRAKNTTVNINCKLRDPKKFLEDFVEIGTLPDVPQRLRMVHGDNPVKFRHAVVPRRGVSKIGAYERRNVLNGTMGQVRGNHASYYHVAVGSELLP